MKKETKRNLHCCNAEGKKNILHASLGGRSAYGNKLKDIVFGKYCTKHLFTGHIRLLCESQMG